MKKNAFRLPIITLFLGVILLSASLGLGAARKEIWVEANKGVRVAQGMHEEPIKVSASLDASGVNQLDLRVRVDKVDIVYGDTDTIEVNYLEDFEGQLVVKVQDNALVVEREQKISWFHLDFGFVYTSYDLSITLPRNVQFEKSRLIVSSGSLKATDVDFGVVERVSVSGGKIDLYGCTLKDVESITVSGGLFYGNDSVIDGISRMNVSGGRVTASNVQAYATMQIRISGGFIELDNCFAPELNASTSGGTLQLKNATIGKLIGTLSGGRITVATATMGTADLKTSGGTIELGSISGLTKLSATISGGTISLQNLNVKHDHIRIATNMSGGRVELNGHKTEGENPAVYELEIVAKISGGRLLIHTKD